MPPTRSIHRVVALAYDGLATFEFGIVAEVFALKRPELGRPLYDFRVATADRNPLRALGGIRVIVDGGVGLLAKADTIVVPGWKGAEVPVPNRLIRAITEAHARGCRIVSICSGAFVLAASGILDGRRATTHWRLTGELQKKYPRIKVEANVLYVDEGNVLTSAGSAAGIDLLLHMVRADYGTKIGNSVARRLVIPPHRDGGQAQFIADPISTKPRNRFGALLQSLEANLQRTHSIAALAQRMNMSERTFIRGFRNAVGMSPMQWVIRARVRMAKELLETSDQSVESISESCGFGAAETLRHHFRRLTKTSPVAFRKMFYHDKARRHRTRIGQ